MRPAAVACLLLAATLVGAPAWAATTEPPTTALEQLMLAVRPREINPPSEIDPVADTIRSYAEANELDSNADWSEATTLNAIALSRRGPVTLEPGDIVEATRVSDTTASSFQVVIPHAAIILNILTLGVVIDATIRDIPFADSFSSSESTLTLRDITDANTLSGLALTTNGIPVDPRVLVDSVSIVARDTSFGEAAFTSVLPPGLSIPLRDVIAAAAVSDFGDSKIPRVFVSSTQALSHAGRVEAARVVEIPEETALLGIALTHQGIPVAASDMMNLAARGGSSIDEAARHGFVKVDVRFALLLGLEVEPK